MEPLRIQVADIVIHVAFDGDFDDDREKRYSAFATTSKPDVEIRLRLNDDHVGPIPFVASSGLALPESCAYKHAVVGIGGPTWSTAGKGQAAC